MHFLPRLKNFKLLHNEAPSPVTPAAAVLESPASASSCTNPWLPWILFKTALPQAGYLL